MNPYEVLGVSPLASGEEIRRFFNIKAQIAYDKWAAEKSEKK